MNNGKKLCKLLRQIRQDIAIRYQLNYSPFECDHKGDCKGTCELCESELLDIQNQLHSKGIYNIEQIYSYNDLSVIFEYNNHA